MSELFDIEYFLPISKFFFMLQIRLRHTRIMQFLGWGVIDSVEKLQWCHIWC